MKLFSKSDFSWVGYLKGCKSLATTDGSAQSLRLQGNYFLLQMSDNTLGDGWPLLLLRVSGDDKFGFDIEKARTQARRAPELGCPPTICPFSAIPHFLAELPYRPTSKFSIKSTIWLNMVPP
jgi:hypothetical protein